MEKKIERSSYARSTFLWILVLFLSANFAWGFIRPLQSVPHSSQSNLELSKAALRFKLDELKTGKSPDILIIGSSLPMCAFFYTERPPFFDLKEGAKIRALGLNLLQAYPEAGYFKAKLKEITRKDLAVFNFAGAACMVSDTALVMERTMAARKKPRLIIYGVGLRDFVDNINPPPGETPYYKALCNLPFILKHISQVYYFPSFTELTIGAICKLYDLRNEFRMTAEHLACQTLHHPSNFQIAFLIADLNKQMKVSEQNLIASKQKPTELQTKAPLSTTALCLASAPPASSSTAQAARISADNVQLSALDYRQRYTPADYKRLNNEMNELQTFIDTCKQKGIKLVLINMPVSQGHRNLSPPGLREKYLQKLRSIGPQADLFLDYENEKLPDADFFDTVHLNGTGSVEFVDELAGRLQSSGLLQD